ncbi:MAG: membrane protein insertase YidC [Bacteroidales bacterium]|nr:membrane protein insertase YidC [Bacteroidales bacterium]MBQ7819047.1 membrane protein insertase YidC [Bacteroidales bacterium]
MDKNTIIGFLLIAALLFGYSWLNQPSQEEIEQAKKYNDSIALVQQEMLQAIAEAEAIKAQTENVVTDSAMVDAQLKAEFGEFSSVAQGVDSIITLSNNLVDLQFNSKGGVLSKATLKEYSRYDSLPLVLFDESDNNYGIIFKTQGRVVDSNDLYFSAEKNSDSTVVMSLATDNGANFAVKYTLPSDSYMLKMEIEQEGMNNVLPKNTAHLDFYWNQKLRSQEKGRMFEERNSALYYKFVGSDVDYLSETDDDKETFNTGIKWLGFKNQFFSSAFIADHKFNGAEMTSSIIEGDSAYLKNFDVKTSFDYNPANAQGPSFRIFLGPNLYPLLKSYDKGLDDAEQLDLDRLIPLGISLFRWINTILVIPVFTFLGGFISNYGIIILLLTIIIKLILLPLTYKSYMSTAKMRVLRPQVEEINKKYPGNEKAMERQRATMDLYSKAGANPMSGCLPMLLQMPILIAMFAFFPSSIELRGEPFLWAEDLSSYDSIFSWDMYIPLITPFFGNHISLFCLLMTITNIIYTKINMDSQATGSQMPGMKAMMYLMPLMFLVFFNNYASGLSYYYFVSLLITILQTYAFRKLINEEKVLAKLKENQKKPRKKSGFMARLEEAQKRQEALMRERAKQQAKRR